METLGLPRFFRSPKLLAVTPLAQQPPRAPLLSTLRPSTLQPSRSLVAWLALVLLIGVGHVVPALHFLFVAHHLCAEHGELVDAAEPPRESAGAAERAASAEKAGDLSAANSAAVRVSGAAGHSHEHCGVFAATRAAAAVAAVPAGARVLPALERAALGGEARDAHLDIALLHYAPKLAPPARVALARA